MASVVLTLSTQPSVQPFVFVDSTLIGGSTPSLQYLSSESLASSGQEALAEEQPAAPSVGSSTKSICSSLLCAAHAYLEALNDELQFHALVGLEQLLSPPSSHAPSLQFILEHLDHTTGSTSVTGSASTPAPSSLHQPNRLVSNRVNITIQVEEWRQSIPREQYHPYRHINQVDWQRRVHWPCHDLERNTGEYLRLQERRNYRY